MRLQDQVVIVSGGSQGIGEAIARRFAREGARVAVVGSSDRAKAESVAQAIRAEGGVAQGFACDVRDPTQVERLFDQAREALGEVDTAVAGAGVFYPTPAGATPEADVDRMLDINLKGSWNLASAAAARMKPRGRGRILCIASVAAVYGVPPFALYCATKAAIVQMVRALALELAPHGIRVNALAPGNTASPMNAAMRADPAAMAAITAATPSGRPFSSVEDMAAIAAFLASDDARAMHGACVYADEGISLGMPAAK